MKIDRLIGILSVLLQEEKVTAPELAKMFEVSRRTISRDVEDLCKAGIPIFTSQGAGGGISIMDGYKMDRTILSSWNKASLSPKIELIQDAIELGKTLGFQYYAPSGNTVREMEPYFLIFNTK